MIPKQQGFTLIEALLAAAVIGILAMVALPTYEHYRAATLSGTVRAELVTRLMQASTTAAVRGEHVVLCPSGGKACIGSDDWSPGILAFVDRDGNRHFDPVDMLLYDAPPTPPGIQLRSTAGRQRIVFQPNGGSAGSNVTFTLCDRRGPAKAMSVILANGGTWRQAPASPRAAATACRS
jgi:type IV fimbrial biogenesis protein FimT